MSDDNVIPISARSRLETVRPTAEIKPAVPCTHARVLLDEDERTVECVRCKAKIDAFEALLKYAKQERYFVYTAKTLVAERDRLEKEIVELKRQRANLGAQIRRRTKTA